MKKELKKLSATINDIERIRNAIKKIIIDLPDNPRIKRINANCFTVSSKDLFANKKSISNWTPFFHDFKKQYKKIVEIIEKSRPENITTQLNLIIENGRLEGKEYIFFHPEVITTLKSILA